MFQMTQCKQKQINKMNETHFIAKKHYIVQKKQKKNENENLSHPLQNCSKMWQLKLCSRHYFIIWLKWNLC